MSGNSLSSSLCHPKNYHQSSCESFNSVHIYFISTQFISICIVQQESLGFSPNDLVFGHRVRGPLSVLREGLGEEDPPQNLVEYVNGFRRRLFLAGLSAQQNLAVAQEKMKNHFDKHAEGRVFTSGDQVLIVTIFWVSFLC